MNAPNLDTRVRLEAFAFLEQQTELYGTELPRELLVRDFRFESERVPLLGPQGIFKPAVLPELPLSITTTPPSDREPAAYDDQLNEDGVLAYRYRGTDPNHRHNVALGLAMRRQVPLAYFYGLVPGRYEAIWPVFGGDGPTSRGAAHPGHDHRLDGQPRRASEGSEGRCPEERGLPQRHQRHVRVR